MIASEEASRTGGIWFSVCIWDGMAGEVGSRALSCTSRSNICDPAGEVIRGDEECSRRPGEEGVILGLSRGAGDVVDDFVVSLLTVLGGLTSVDSIFEGVCVDVLSSCLFLPSPNKPRFFGLCAPFPVSCSGCFEVDSISVGMGVPVEGERSPKPRGWFFS